MQFGEREALFRRATSPCTLHLLPQYTHTHTKPANTTRRPTTPNTHAHGLKSDYARFPKLITLFFTTSSPLRRQKHSGSSNRFRDTASEYIVQTYYNSIMYLLTALRFVQCVHNARRVTRPDRRSPPITISFVPSSASVSDA